MKPELRVLVIAHGHPALSKGGGEVAAYNLFRGLKSIPGVTPFFLGGTRDKAYHLGTPFSVHKHPDEILFHVEMQDFFVFSHPYKPHVYEDFAILLSSIRPDVVHFHHYVHLGVELVRQVRRTLPKARIVLTLHEFLAICHSQGQMVKTGSKALCERSSPRDCHGCFPKIPSIDFFLRENYLKSHFALVDRFISPSRFLAERYIAWGIPADDIAVLENAQDPAEPEIAGSALDAPRTEPVQIGFFGQLNPFKGVDLLLKAVALLEPDEREQLRISLHGANLEGQEEAFRKEMASLLDGVSDCVVSRGSYQQPQLPELMRAVHWVIVPSIWWENSPMVIQEAFKFGRPVIASRLGGMAEKIRDGVDGLLFTANDAAALAKILRRVVQDRELWTKLRKNCRAPKTSDAIAAEHVELYNGAKKAAAGSSRR